MKHLISLEKISKTEILEIISLAEKIKKYPEKYKNKLNGKKLLMLFAKPSLRTRVSFEVAMLDLGGHAIFYDITNSPLGKKESIKDFSRVSSEFVDVIMARLFEHDNMEELAKYSDVPVISGLDDEEHPCQVLADIQTLKQKFKNLENLTITYIGDANNNVTHSLLYACTKLEINLIICCPNKEEFLPNKKILNNAKKFAINSTIRIETNPYKAIENSNVVYTDSFMSYHIKESEKERRLKILMPYQVNKKLIEHAKKDIIFMHCLPATRGEEVTDEVIDSKNSIVYQQAKNRLYTEMSILLKLLKLN